MRLREYVESDAAETLRVFLRAVRETASRDYSPEQIEAWVGADRDPAEWHAARAAANTRVAALNGAGDGGDVVAGFIDVSAEGYIDMLFVDPAHGRRGVATALLAWAESTAARAGAARLSTHASITARPFFEAQGFVVLEERRPVRRGVELTNHLMVRPIGAV